MPVDKKKKKTGQRKLASWKKMSDADKAEFVRSAISTMLTQRRKAIKENAGFYDFSNSSSSNVYRGARSGKHNEDWLVSTETADKELLDSLPTLRYRTRQLTKDNGLAEGTLIAYVGMAVGDGPTITSRANDIDAAKQVQDVIDSWIDNCDITGEKTLTDILENIVTGCCNDGDVLINLPVDSTLPANAIQTRVQLVEADRISTPSGYTYTGYRIRHGVRYTASGSVDGYYVTKLGDSENEHSYLYSGGLSIDNYNFMSRYASDNRLITWLFKRPGAIERPGQSRQLPLFSSCIDLLKDIEDLLDAHIIGTRAAACIMGFIKSDNPEGLLDAILEDPDTDSQLTDKYGQKYSKMQPASIIPLRTGEDISLLDPKRDNAGTEPLIVRLAKFLSMKVRIPYPILFLDLSEINYSSYRGGILEARRVFKRFRNALAVKAIRPMLRTVITEAYYKGMLPAVKTLTEDVLVPRVDFPAWGYIDQEKETKAEALAIEKGLTTYQRVAAEHGENWSEILEERFLFENKRRELITKYGQPIDNQGDGNDK